MARLCCWVSHILHCASVQPVPLSQAPPSFNQPGAHHRAQAAVQLACSEELLRAACGGTPQGLAAHRCRETCTRPQAHSCIQAGPLQADWLDASCGAPRSCWRSQRCCLQRRRCQGRGTTPGWAALTGHRPCSARRPPAQTSSRASACWPHRCPPPGCPGRRRSCLHAPACETDRRRRPTCWPCCCLPPGCQARGGTSALSLKQPGHP